MTGRLTLMVRLKVPRRQSARRGGGAPRLRGPGCLVRPFDWPAPGRTPLNCPEPIPDPPIWFISIIAPIWLVDIGISQKIRRGHRIHEDPVHRRSCPRRYCSALAFRAPPHRSGSTMHVGFMADIMGISPIPPMPSRRRSRCPSPVVAAVVVAPSRRAVASLGTQVAAGDEPSDMPAHAAITPRARKLS